MSENEMGKDPLKPSGLFGDKITVKKKVLNQPSLLSQGFRKLGISGNASEAVKSPARALVAAERSSGFVFPHLRRLQQDTPATVARSKVDETVIMPTAVGRRRADSIMGVRSSQAAWDSGRLLEAHAAVPPLMIGNTGERLSMHSTKQTQWVDEDIEGEDVMVRPNEVETGNSCLMEDVDPDRDSEAAWSTDSVVGDADVAVLSTSEEEETSSDSWSPCSAVEFSCNSKASVINGGKIQSPATLSDLATLAVADAKCSTGIHGWVNLVRQPSKKTDGTGEPKDLQQGSIAAFKPQPSNPIPVRNSTREKVRVDSNGSPVPILPQMPVSGGVFPAQENAVPTSTSVSKADPAPAKVSINGWSKFTSAADLGVNRKGHKDSSYQLPTTFVHNTYGTPKAVKPTPAAIAVDPAMTNSLFFTTWPRVENRGNRAMPRTIIITELPEDPTFTMVSAICRNAGLIETITIVRTMRKALVWFIEAADAQRFHDANGNGIEFLYDRGGKTYTGVVFIDMKKELDVLASAMRTNVKEKGHTRTIRIVGWERKDLEKIVGIKGKEESVEVMLKRLAEEIVLEKKVEKVESAEWSMNRLGHYEATLVFSGIKEAYYALGQLHRKPELEKCNITFGKDPCEP